jgi:glycosyltransferase involved in cell wall biosynthesis
VALKLHLIGLPHTQTIVEQMTVCAFTQKIVKFGEMMTPLGYEIILYSGEHNDTICAEHVSVFTDAQQREWYGDHDPNLLPTIATWGADLPHWQQMNHQAIVEISKRIEPEDLILILAGLAQKPIADAFPGNISCEWAAGYDGIFAPFVCFESYAWMHYLYGRYFGNGSGGQGRWYDTVIPNYFRAEDFRFEEQPGDYLLFVGRITASKGPHIAAEIAAASGRKLLVAGSGVAYAEPGLIRAAEGFEIKGDVEYVGIADVQMRNDLMANAYALIAATTYIEPFGAVNVEAQLCGTPVLTTDWGAFTETVEHGRTGFRFRTLAEAVEAVELAGGLDRTYIRERARRRYSLERIGGLYDNWFRRLDDLHRGGWYEGTTKVPLAVEGFVTDGHLGGYIEGGDPATYYPDLWRWFVDKQGVKSVLDVGCGAGIAVDYFDSRGVEAVGVDGIEQPSGRIFQHDFTTGPWVPPRNPADFEGRYDLCWCCEFVEHIPEGHIGNFLATFQHCEMVALTHAFPGQEGWNHVNCQEPDYWIDRLKSAGYTLDPGLTKQARKRAAKNKNAINHFVRSGMVFVRD